MFYYRTKKNILNKYHFLKTETCTKREMTADKRTVYRLKSKKNKIDAKIYLNLARFNEPC